MASAGEVSARSVTALVDRGLIDHALADARHLTEQQPTDPASWRTLGYVEAVRKASKEAEQALLHAISLAPKDVLSWEHLGWLYRRAGDFTREAVLCRLPITIRYDPQMRGRSLNPLTARPRRSLVDAELEIGPRRAGGPGPKPYRRQDLVVAPGGFIGAQDKVGQ